MEPAWKALSDLHDVLDRYQSAGTRAATEDTRTGAAEVAGHVAHVAGHFAEPTLTPTEDAIPEAAAVAMAGALLAEPHSRRTLAVQSTASESIVIRADAALTVALSLSDDVVIALRNDIDRRVAEVLTRIRAMQTLWSRSGNPRRDPLGLHRLLFPGEADLPAIRYQRNGCRLYAIVQMKQPPPPESLSMPWHPDAPGWSALPDHRFDPSHLDDSLLRTVGRAIGVSGDALRDMLGRIVCVIPEEGAATFMARDRWRAEGWADVTGLGAPRSALDGLERLTPASLQPETWMTATPEGGVAMHNAQRVFDAVARQRVTTLLRGLYTELCARQLARHGRQPADQAALFDLPTFMRHALQPVIDWTGRPDVQAHVAQTVGVSPAAAAAALAQLRDVWSRQVDGPWCGAPSAKRPHTIVGILTAHLARVQASLSTLERHPPDPRAAHHRMLLLFFAHHVARAPLGRLWRPVNGQLPEPEDIAGAWFWPAWQRVLDVAAEPDPMLMDSDP